jgi:hypothetical protein
MKYSVAELLTEIGVAALATLGSAGAIRSGMDDAPGGAGRGPPVRSPGGSPSLRRPDPSA